MKHLFVLIVLLSVSCLCNAQLLKRIGNSIKQKAEQKVKSEADKAVDKTLDKGIEKATVKKEKQTETPEQPTPPPTIEKENTAPPVNAEPTAATSDSEGFIEMQLSTSVIFTGGTLLITGKTGTYATLNKTDLVISGPASANTYPILLDKEGNFSVTWVAPATAGKYKATAAGSDKKATKEIEFTVEYLDELDEMATENIFVTNKLLEVLSKRVDESKRDLSSKHAGEADKKMKELAGKADKLKGAFAKINEAGRIFANAATKGAVLPKNLSANLSELKGKLQEHKDNSQQILKNIEHNAAAYTICETLEMVSEACAAFSTATNFTGKISSVIKNLALDKAVPAAATALNEYAFDKKVPNEAVVPGIKFFTAASQDFDGLISGAGPMGLAGDMAQLFSNILLKEYCSSFEGEVSQQYTVDFRNINSVTWWKYGYATKAKITLRYPKNKGSGSTIQMKGHIEGNAVKFSFYQNVSAADEIQSITKNHVPLVQVAVVGPAAVPFATSTADAAGFGMMARAVATPSYFNLPVDAVYNKETETIRLFLTDGGIDFTPMVRYRVLFCSPIPLPIFKVQEFPINKARLTMNAVIKRYGEYKMMADNKGGLSFSGTNTHHAGTSSSDTETKVILTIKAKN